MGELAELDQIPLQSMMRSANLCIWKSSAKPHLALVVKLTLAVFVMATICYYSCRVFAHTAEGTLDDGIVVTVVSVCVFDSMFGGFAHGTHFRESRVIRVNIRQLGLRC
ncbi:hypothetical protein BDR06DRAFT_953270 [Suillus hirtellus]|nr:hypothetical protein BDR06DRAFT_953270 [Suillus hirtellus]